MLSPIVCYLQIHHLENIVAFYNDLTYSSRNCIDTPTDHLVKIPKRIVNIPQYKIIFNHNVSLDKHKFYTSFFYCFLIWNI